MVKHNRGKVVRDHWQASDMPSKGSTITNKSGTANSPFTYTVADAAFTGTGELSATLQNGSPLPEWLTFTPATKVLAGTTTTTTTVHVRILKTNAEVIAKSDFDVVIT